MKLINLFLEEVMPSKKRGNTKFVSSNHIKHTMRFEVIDNVK